MRICVSCCTPLNTVEWSCTHCGWKARQLEGFPILGPDMMLEGASYPKAAHQQLVQIEEKSFWFANRNRLLIRVIERNFPLVEKMLEIGCGTGFVLSSLVKARPKTKFFGGEAYLSGLRHARERIPSVELAQMDGFFLPFINEFDVIGAFDVLEHIPEDEMVLREMFKALKSGGGVLVTVPQHKWLWSCIDDQSGHKRRYTREMLTKKLESAGFKVLYSTSFVSFLLPFMLLSRALIFKKRESLSVEQAGLRLPASVNKVFEWICCVENYLILAGISMPVGGSLLCVAQRP